MIRFWGELNKKFDEPIEVWNFLLHSTSSLTEFLGCFNKNDYIYLGERYGYDLFSEDSGYNYITGGGGIVFSLKTVKRIVKSCSCPSPSSPDDMIIASCLRQFEIEPIHSTLFHQARPKDYPADVISRNSISFHKFWQIDPVIEYAKRFRKKDEEYFEINKHLAQDFKYLNRECMSSQAVENNFNQNVNQNEISHAELWCWNDSNKKLALIAKINLFFILLRSVAQLNIFHCHPVTQLTANISVSLFVCSSLRLVDYFIFVYARKYFEIYLNLDFGI